ncbi:hypothetical protein QUO91_002747, partial [Enterococcus faecalis]|nr:hypothetical protein [Enterococcus faecalis]
MDEEILNFITKYPDKVTTDVAKRLVMKFTIPVNHVQDYNFLDCSDKVRYKFIYNDRTDDTVNNLKANNPKEFLEIFFKGKHMEVQKDVSITIT